MYHKRFVIRAHHELIRYCNKKLAVMESTACELVKTPQACCHPWTLVLIHFSFPNGILFPNVDFFSLLLLFVDISLSDF